MKKFVDCFDDKCECIDCKNERKKMWAHPQKMHPQNLPTSTHKIPTLRYKDMIDLDKSLQ